MPAWYTCTVTRAGPAEDGAVYVALTDVSGGARFTNQWFKATDSTKRLILKTTLRAIANNKIAQCSLSDVTEYSTIFRFYIIAVTPPPPPPPPPPPLPCEQYCEPAFAQLALQVNELKRHGDTTHAYALENLARHQLLDCLTQHCPSGDIQALFSQITMRYLSPF
jgi:hypothetical protein